MATIFIVIVGFLCDGIVRGRKLSFEGRLNSWKLFLKKQGVHFYRNGSPFDLKIVNFWPVLYPRPSRLSRNHEGWIHWVNPLRDAVASFGVECCPPFPPPRSLQIWAFCPIR
ncbi:MAG: hypothetical protein CO149_06090 [Nitrospirae bacterium CG_4_9_14_3_um_filter_51_5]|nr:MAG: hypothetical protein CO149_06090 [Nitrospirae bacterium CG_4_9_14_3_um_filter_51_5]